MTETTKKVLWRKFKEATDKVDFLKYIQTVSIDLYGEIMIYFMQDDSTDYESKYEAYNEYSIFEQISSVNYPIIKGKRRRISL